ncbi:adenosylmethionine decarboxylase proenzyme [Thermosediminibacter litoriperuensis]|uniref:S-adenosylmethionine decarboxylase proenzyme n=2 Tax=Thermosediminibacter litoriperuensis TaxID=291989 RepID=A0A5S5AYS9_9FIRM|nr:adenosylmethionine decarboxylase proenzyme [Thermosediminibacter litoriperuensis]
MAEIQRYTNKITLKWRTGGIFQGFFSNLLTFCNNLLQFNLIDSIQNEGGCDSKMKALGRHILAEIYDCDPNVLNDRDLIEEIMVKAALEAGAEVREVAFHKFSPQGVSGVVVISESHLTVHTWPELGYAAVDVFTCGDKVNPWDACNYIAERFEAKHMTASEVKRGVFEKPVKVVNF